MKQFQEAVRQGSFHKHSSLDFIPGKGVGSVLSPMTSTAADAYSLSGKRRAWIPHHLIHTPNWQYIFSAATILWLPTLNPATLLNHVLRTYFHKTVFKSSSEIQFCVNAYVMSVHEKR